MNLFNEKCIICNTSKNCEKENVLKVYKAIFEKPLKNYGNRKIKKTMLDAYKNEKCMVYPAGIYLFKIKNEDRKGCNIC